MNTRDQGREAVRVSYERDHAVRRIEALCKGGKRTRVRIYEPNGPESEKLCGTIYVDPGSVEWFCTQLIPDEDGDWI